MSAGFGYALGVVRLQVSTGTWLATVPMIAGDAKAYAAKVKHDVERSANNPQMVEFDTGDGLPCWVRGRDVSVVDVVPTGDPSTEGATR